MNTHDESHLVHGRRVRPEGPSPVDVISVQSQLVYGHAGNSAAVPPLRALGLRVAEVPTTLLSNAPFYSTLRGRMLLLGVSERGIPARAKTLVSGYFGTVENGEVFAEWAARTLAGNPQLAYWLDPVIGDTHTGPYVEPALEAVFRDKLLPLATVVTPNAFELGRLTGRDALAQDDAIAAARELLARGPKWVIAHSVEGAPGELVTLAVSADAVWRWTSEHLPVDVAGTGDVLLGLTMAFVLRGEPMPMAISRAIAGVHAALEATLAADVEEFDVLSAAPAAQLPPGRFRGQRLA